MTSSHHTAQFLPRYKQRIGAAPGQYFGRGQRLFYFPITPHSAFSFRQYSDSAISPA